MLNGAYILSKAEKYPVMAARLLMVKHLPVKGILTTNYDQLLCFCDRRRAGTAKTCCVCRGFTPQTTDHKPDYLTLIRSQEPRPGADQGRPIIQIHGSTSDPASIVFTRCRGGRVPVASSTDACSSWQKVQGREANRRCHRLTEPTIKALCQPPPPPPHPRPDNFFSSVPVPCRCGCGCGSWVGVSVPVTWGYGGGEW